MFVEPYADREPNRDGPIDPRNYGITEWISLADLVEEIRQVFKIDIDFPTPGQAA